MSINNNNQNYPSKFHHHDPFNQNQNLGNTLGANSCIRQSKLFRRDNSGNAMKELLGSVGTKWDVNKNEGAFKGQQVYDAYRK